MHVKLTKGELKRQRDSLHQFERYLPTLQLKKQQLQIEILKNTSALAACRHALSRGEAAILSWAGLFSDPFVTLSAYLAVQHIHTASKNIAGVSIFLFQQVEFVPAEYDLFRMPLWVDHAIDALRHLVSLRAEEAILEQGIDALRQELRITTQRVNLFEKIKIPQAQEAIRVIKIYIGDQLANAVGRSKLAKVKIEAAELMEALA